MSRADPMFDCVDFVAMQAKVWAAAVEIEVRGKQLPEVDVATL
jgi:hypothetical protein